jgi:hypothetical protein
MDLLRSCYTVPMTFSPGAAPVDVRWFFARPGAKLFPAEHAFNSGNWNTGEDIPDIGEQARQPLPWSNGARPSCAQGRGRFLGDLKFFQTGQPIAFAPAYPLDVVGIPGACCCSQDSGEGESSAAPTPGKGCGGVLLGGADQPGGLGGCIARNPVQAFIDDSGGCPAISGPLILWPQRGQGLWAGSSSAIFGGPLVFRLTCTELSPTGYQASFYWAGNGRYYEGNYVFLDGTVPPYRYSAFFSLFPGTVACFGSFYLRLGTIG